MKYIDHRTFQGCSSLTSITIPESVVQIGDNLFIGCSNLTSIIFKGDTEVFGDSFIGLNENIQIKFSENSRYKQEGEYILTKDGKTLVVLLADRETYTIPEGVTELGGWCFSYRDVTSITIPEGVTKLGDWCFSGCSNLTSISLPQSVTELGDLCFRYSGIREINLYSSLTSIGERCFELVPNDIIVTVTMVDGYEDLSNLRAALPEGATINVVLPGDANGDGRVSATDITTIADYIVTGNESLINKAAADANKDGRVSATDITAIASMILN